MKKVNIFEKMRLKLMPKILQNLDRPKNIPIYAPDCGWNHGQNMENSKEKMCHNANEIARHKIFY